MAAKQPPPPPQPQQIPISASSPKSTFTGPKYSRETLLGLFKELPAPPSLDVSLQIFSEDSLHPIGNDPFNDTEKPIWESHNLNSEITKRTSHQKRGADFKGRGKGRSNFNSANTHQNHHQNQPQQSPLEGENTWTRRTNTQIGSGNAHRKQFDQQQPQRDASTISENQFERLATEEDTQLQEDIWDLPSKDEAPGSFANGAFFSTNVSASAPSPVSNDTVSHSTEKDWRKPEATVETLTNSFAAVGLGSIGITNSWNTPAPQAQTHQMPAIQPERYKQPYVEMQRVPLPQIDPIWFYKDPQGSIQGPFTGAEMQQWFDAGYFPDNLLVKSSMDDRFDELITYVNLRMGGQVNFLIMPNQLSRPTIDRSNSPFGSTHVSEAPIRVQPYSAPRPLVSKVAPEAPHSSWFDSFETGWKTSAGNNASPSRLREPSIETQYSHTSSMGSQVPDVKREPEMIKPSTLQTARPKQSAAAIQPSSHEAAPVSSTSGATWKPAQSHEPRKSLKEIQELEEAERAIKQAEQAKLKASQAKQALSDDPVIVKASEAGAVWGGVPTGSRPKTLAEIQKEEERRKSQASLESQSTASRRYAETVAPNQPRSTGSASWAGKVTSSSPIVSSIPPRVLQRPVPSAAKKSSNTISSKDSGSMTSSIESLYTAPSTPYSESQINLPTKMEAKDETLKWLQDQIKPLEQKIDVGSFVEILAPLDDPYTITEIIHDAIGTNYLLVDPKKISAEYIKRRHKQGKISGNLVIPSPPPHSAYAQANRSQTTDGRSSDDKGFVPVKSRKKSNKKAAPAVPAVVGASVGVGGRTVVGSLPKGN